MLVVVVLVKPTDVVCRFVSCSKINLLRFTLVFLDYLRCRYVVVSDPFGL